MCEALGYRVIRLRRVRIMHIPLDDLEVGEWRDLSEEEIAELHRRCEPKTSGEPREAIGAGSPASSFDSIEDAD